MRKMKYYIFLFFVTMCFGSLIKAEDADDDDDDFVPFLGDRKDRFDWALCSTLDGRQPGNVIASPVSVKLLLGMIYEGSTGNTSRELENILQLSKSRSTTRYMNSAIIKSLQSPNAQAEFKISSRMFLDRGIGAKNWYKRILALYYETYVENLDFVKPAVAIKEINNWIHVVTRGRINNLIPDDANLADSIFVLLNAVFFSASWKTPFSPDLSFDGAFLAPTGLEKVRYMSQTGLFYYSESEELHAKILRLPYLGGKFAMYILLPFQTNGLNLLLKKINPFVLRRSISQLEQTSVSVTLPQFAYDFTMNLNDVIKEIGVRSIFQNFDDLRGIIKSKKHDGIVVSKIIQKASIQVTESGTTAAAASGIHFVDKFSVSEVEFNASHPFLFYIEDESTGTVTFVGKLVHPQVKSGIFQIDQNLKVPDEDVTKTTYEPEKFSATEVAGLMNELFSQITTTTDKSSVAGRIKKGLLDGSSWEMSRSP